MHLRFVVISINHNVMKTGIAGTVLTLEEVVFESGSFIIFEGQSGPVRNISTV